MHDIPVIFSSKLNLFDRDFSSNVYCAVLLQINLGNVEHFNRLTGEEGLRVLNSKVFSSELKTLELNTLSPNRLI